MVTYFQTVGDKEMPIVINESDAHLFARINKQHSYQDTALEEKAMMTLSGDAFKLYCALSMKPPCWVWAFSAKNMPFSFETFKRCLNELSEKGYATSKKLLLTDRYGEVVEIDGIDFWEKPIETETKN